MEDVPMTFLHKLSKRLARLKAGTLIAVAAVSAAAAFVGCELPISEPLPTVSRLVVSPKTVTLTPDESQDFMAVGFTAAGDTAQVDVTWSATGGSVGDKGTQHGRHYGWYKNGMCGNYVVTAMSHPGNVSDAASVTVTCPGTVASVSVTPPAASVAPGYALAFGHRRVVEVGVEGVVAAAVVHDHRRQIGAHVADQRHGARGDGPDGRAGRRADADPVPGDARVAGTRRGTELVEQPAVHRPVELAEARGRDGGRSGRGAARLGLAAGALEARDEVGDAPLLAAGGGEALLCFLQAAPRDLEA